MSINNNWIPKGAVYYNQPSTVAVIFDPEGGHHICNDITDERYDSNPRYWCGGIVGNSPEELANRLHDHWWDDTFNEAEIYLQQLACFGEDE